VERALYALHALQVVRPLLTPPGSWTTRRSAATTPPALVSL